MPFKHNESRSHKFIKPKYKVTNWTAYNDSLRQRGDIISRRSIELPRHVLGKALQPGSLVIVDSTGLKVY